MKTSKCEFFITLIAIGSALGQSCKLSSGAEGYCREKDDCLGPSEGSGCQDGLSCCQNNVKSHQKCKDYGKYVYKEGFGEALTVRRAVQNVSECATEAVPLVVGGGKANPKEFPHMVVIGYGDDIKKASWLCGGSLISENFILTAAHCSESLERGPAKFARLGMLNLKSVDDPNVQDFNIIEIINHPKYKQPSRYYDIGLFKLSDSVKMNGFARPACVHVAPDESAFKRATATGWGKLDYNDPEGSPDLMKVDLSLIDSEKCNSSFTSELGGHTLTRGVVSSQLCAGELEGGKDTCQGDSGGPLQIAIDDPYCMYTLIGVTSFGKFCGFKNSPAVYTRISYFVPWIESIVWN